MLNAQHRRSLIEEGSKLSVSWPRSINSEGIPTSIQKWLEELHLEQYIPNFTKNMYTDPARLVRLWNDELTTVLEIQELGHRRRLLLAGCRGSSAAGRPRSSNSPRLENGTDESESEGSLPLRDPVDLVSGVSSALKTAWRHTPETLIDGSVTYRAIVRILFPQVSPPSPQCPNELISSFPVCGLEFRPGVLHHRLNPKGNFGNKGRGGGWRFGR